MPNTLKAPRTVRLLGERDLSLIDATNKVVAPDIGVVRNLVAIARWAREAAAFIRDHRANYDHCDPFDAEADALLSQIAHEEER